MKPQRRCDKRECVEREGFSVKHQHVSDENKKKESWRLRRNIATDTWVETQISKLILLLLASRNEEYHLTTPLSIQACSIIQLDIKIYCKNIIMKQEVHTIAKKEDKQTIQLYYMPSNLTWARKSL